jgi:AcrR family transcriptional regulator
VSEVSAEHPIIRSTYRHGDLRGALVAAGLAMARVGGPDAVVLREATRQAGVTPNAAYRHFADRGALLRAVSDAAQGLAADRMEAEVAAAATPGPAGQSPAGSTETNAGRATSAGARGTATPVDSTGPAGLLGASPTPEEARRMLRAVGTGYLRFAREEPGLFRAAFSVPDHLMNSTSPAKAGAAGRTPFSILSAALDAYSAAGILPPDRRQNAELYAWSAVHGLGMLVIDGPLRGLDDTMVDAATTRVLDMVERGL